jgi:ring-1,2-phenylacetyl-CoA epoxidase subunit PaaC
VSAQAPPQLDVVLACADDELVLGWRDSEWTGIAPFLEEDVAFSSIAQTEIGHARALYEFAARELGKTADELAFDRNPEDYRCAALCELDLVPDWAGSAARRYLYETADAIRIEALKESGSAELAGLTERIDREEAYHRMHAEMWIERLRSWDEGAKRLDEALERLWPYALGLLEGEQRDAFAERVGRAEVEAVERGQHTDDLRALWEEMTMVRRSAPGASW